MNTLEESIDNLNKTLKGITESIFKLDFRAQYNCDNCKYLNKDFCEKYNIRSWARGIKGKNCKFYERNT